MGARGKHILKFYMQLSSCPVSLPFLKVPTNEVKVLTGFGISIPISANHNPLKDVATIKFGPDDFCILTLRNVVDITEFVAPICLPHITDKFHNSSEANIVGFGYGHLEEFQTRNWIRKDVKLMSWEECKNRFGHDGRECSSSEVHHLDGNCYWYRSIVSDIKGEVLHKYEYRIIAL